MQKNLELYLESKRTEFPRFYFLSNDELLQILASAQEITKIEQHLNKCFDNIVNLGLGDTDEIQAMISQEKERVPLLRSVKVRSGDTVEKWLGTVQSYMIESLQRYIKNGYLSYYEEDRKKWVKK